MKELNNDYFVLSSVEFEDLSVLVHQNNGYVDYTELKGLNYIKVEGLEYKIITKYHNNLCYLELI